MLNGNRALTLTDGKLLPTPGPSIGGNGSNRVLTLDGDEEDLSNVGLILAYKASVQ